MSVTGNLVAYFESDLTFRAAFICHIVQKPASRTLLRNERSVSRTSYKKTSGKFGLPISTERAFLVNLTLNSPTNVMVRRPGGRRRTETTDSMALSLLDIGCQKINFIASWTIRGLELAPMIRPKSPGLRMRPVTGSMLPPVALTTLMSLIGLFWFA